jgi:hypothetical protein
VGPEEGDYRTLLAASAREDLFQAREALQEELPELFPALVRGSRAPSAGGLEPDGDAFLPRDTIRFDAGRMFERGGGAPLEFRVVQAEPQAGVPLFPSQRLSVPEYAASPPASGWAPGAYHWSMSAREGLAAGSFQILGAEASALAARVERELAGNPGRQAVAYWLMGLEQRAELTAATLPPNERDALLRRFGRRDAGGPR